MLKVEVNMRQNTCPILVISYQHHVVCCGLYYQDIQWPNHLPLLLHGGGSSIFRGSLVRVGKSLAEVVNLDATGSLWQLCNNKGCWYEKRENFQARENWKMMGMLVFKTKWQWSSVVHERWFSKWYDVNVHQIYQYNIILFWNREPFFLLLIWRKRGLAGPGRSRRPRRPNAFECLQLRRSTSFDWCWWGFCWLFRPGKDFWSINHSLWGIAFEQSTSTAKPDDEMQTVALLPPLCFEDRSWSISIFKGCMKCGDAAEFVAFMAELWHAELHWQ